MDSQFWLFTTIILVLIAVIGFLLRERFKSIIDKLSELVDTVNKAMNLIDQQDEKNENVKNKLAGHSSWLKEHEERLREVEKTCSKCEQ